MQDPSAVFDALCLSPGAVFLDLGCGAGEYALHAAKIVGPRGLVYALDSSRVSLDALLDLATHDGLHNVEVLAADILRPLPLPDECVDVCFAATVLHAYELDRIAAALFPETRRVLKPGGHLAVLECKKEDWGFGPPLDARHTPEQIATAAHETGFEQIAFAEFQYNYLIQFSASSGQASWMGQSFPEPEPELERG